jgi:hypothetical protein
MVILGAFSGIPTGETDGFRVFQAKSVAESGKLGHLCVNSPQI